MSASPIYRHNVRGVLNAARNLEEVLDKGDESEVLALAGDLLSAALARESAGAVAGLEEHDAPAVEGLPAPTAEDELTLALTELEVGEVLLASAAATMPEAPAPAPPTVLAGAVDGLSAADRLQEAGTSAVGNLFAGASGDPQEFFTDLPATVAGIVRRTAQLGADAVTGLATIPGSQVQPLFGAALGTAEALLHTGDKIAALARAGMRAVMRALRALARLVPDNLKDQVGEWARKWWDGHSGTVAQKLARDVLAVSALETRMATAVQAARGRTDLDAALREGADRLKELEQRHGRIVDALDKIVRALGRVIAPVAAAFPPIAAWVLAAGGGGIVAALGITVWMGRDYLDTGVPFERVPGVRLVVARATATPALGD
ncbi:hypothetical protein GCM10010168_70610 [Actinoplanes ianthinogenes]|uniref:Uncharacterized protein n=1 Tax=Actinoplanes ianthinogenes TaxID=122358 RepID=A0ABM7M6Z4_9ACTN|nr:hypothetical protein [Actinoplanes ianthinogenes]BCJ47349.1 hypothetical protein Aiant_80060 [Actinoplanes ianthinogenes]GGR41867.1 hypothetical protein GCM10010168_70610 [Actinoplanes ianthinogenes]